MQHAPARTSIYSSNRFRLRTLRSLKSLQYAAQIMQGSGLGVQDWCPLGLELMAMPTLRGGTMPHFRQCWRLVDPVERICALDKVWVAPTCTTPLWRCSARCCTFALLKRLVLFIPS